MAKNTFPRKVFYEGKTVFQRSEQEEGEIVFVSWQVNLENKFLIRKLLVFFYKFSFMIQF